MDHVKCIEDVVSNQQIVIRLKANDEACFDELYRHYYAPLCAYTSRFVPLDMAEGIVQDTFIWIWTHTEVLVEELSVKGLLFMMVKNRALNMIDRQKNKSRILSELESKMEPQLEDFDLYERDELLHLFNEALHKLSPALREAFLLSRKGGYTHQKIAHLIGVSPQTVNYRISQAMKILRTELKDYLPLLLLFLSQTDYFH